jgi:uncharacterized protein YciI
MFIIELTYKVDVAEIDRHMAAHMAFVRKYYKSGHFVASGRKVPRDGGIILSRGDSREQVEAIAAEDPFCLRGLADARIIEFRVSQQADDLQSRFTTAPL